MHPSRLRRAAARQDSAARHGKPRKTRLIATCATCAGAAGGIRAGIFPSPRPDGAVLPAAWARRDVLPRPACLHGMPGAAFAVGDLPVVGVSSRLEDSLSLWIHREHEAARKPPHAGAFHLLSALQTLTN